MSVSDAEYVARLREALTALRAVRAERDALVGAKTEPLAIVGMACRFPGGGHDPEAYWRSLLDGVDAVREVVPERFPAERLPADKPSTRYAALLDGIDRFDAAFFGISPREAELLDPQQRLLLEVTWEALEHAGQPIERLEGSRTGVFVGMTSVDYQRLLWGDAEHLDSYSATGTMMATAAGRIAFSLGFQGPAMALDTACSSSLVAIHLACQSLRRGESDLCVAGGVNALLGWEPMAILARMQALSPDGRCKSFDSRANGYVRGEGCGVLVLKRLSDARRDRDTILALIRGTAINQDGRSTGLTTPNVLAQEALLREAQADAQLTPDDIGYVETHGTGTPLGDPIEFEALRKVLGKPRADGSKCVLGAVKTNLGHLESAAGVAGVIKAVQALRHGEISKNLHFRALNPRMSLEGTSFVIPTETTPFARGDKPRRAGVSSFGMSGTNAHLILEEAPAEEPASRAEARSAYALPLSAKTPEALVALARAHAERLAAKDADDLSDLVYTASVRRTHHEHRLAVVGGSRQEIAEALRSHAAGEEPKAVVQGRTSPQGAPRITYVFSGQGSQWAGMGRRLLAEEPVFRAKIEECEALLREHVSWSLRAELEAPEETTRLGETEVVQPAIFALQVGLVELLRSWGVSPSAVIGHSVGEVAAAHVSGALSLRDAIRLVVLRGRIMQKATGHGKMAWASVPAEEAKKFLVGREGEISIAAVNDPSSVVLSGKTEAMDDVLGALGKAGIPTRPLRVNYAFHSPQMEPLSRELVGALGWLSPQAGAIPMISTVTGARVQGTELDARYWGRNVRAPVDLRSAVDTALREKTELFLEVGPSPVLLGNLKQCISSCEKSALVVGTLRRQFEDERAMLEALGALHVHGVAVHWHALHPSGGRVVALPTYPWRRERFWFDTSTTTEFTSTGATLPEEPAGQHPLLGVPVEVAALPGAYVFQRRVRPDAPRYLRDHCVAGEVVFPGAGYIEMALAAASHAGRGGEAVVLDDITVEQRLVLDASGALLQILVERAGPSGASFQIVSRTDGSDTWVRHAAGRIRYEAPTEAPAPSTSPEAMKDGLSVVRSAEEHYARMVQAGLSYGPAFRGVERLWIGQERALSRIFLPEEAGPAGAHVLHPALLDACFHSLDGVTAGLSEGAYLLVGVGRLRVRERPEGAAWADIRLRTPSGDRPELVEVDIRIVDDAGRVLVEIDAARARRLASSAQRDALDDCMYVTAWRPRPVAEEPAPEAPSGTGWLVFTDRGGFGDVLAGILAERGARCVRVSVGARFARVAQDRYTLDPSQADEYRALLREAIGSLGSCRGVVHAWSLDATPAEATTEETLLADQRAGCLSALHLTQALARAGLRDAPSLVFVTRGAQAVHEAEAPTSTQAPLWGLGRTIALEHPELSCKRLDLDPQARADEARAVAQELFVVDGEEQVALRSGERFVPRLARMGTAGERSRRVSARGRSFRVEQPEPGVLERLELRSIERRAPGPSEVEIEVEAAGLNFIDVLKAMGIYPGLEAGAMQLGNECAGRISALGADVRGFFVGQAVVVSAVGAFSTHVTTPSAFVAPKPDRLSFEQAASILAVFTTVQFAIRHVGRAQRGEKILIHSATGGTGLAAVQLARALGLEIFATAGSEDKRAYLRSLGIERVMDSRALAFADEILEATGGAGVDLVLNSLTGDAIGKGFEVLSPFGRFLELGKRDIYDNRRLGLLPFRKSLSYTAIDLAGMTLVKPALFSSLVEEVVALFDEGKLAPLPVTAFPASRADEAFRLMAQARHIGKIVLTMKDPDARLVVSGDERKDIIRGDATYLVTGGHGGLGLTVARWLVERGARHLVLVGRSAPSEAVEEAIRAMESAGATVCSVRADVSRRADVERVVSDIEARLPPLRGLVHAAGVLADHSLLELTADHFRRVFEPKALGAWLLHERTRRAPLDFFVLYSSSSGLIGSPGQGNYAAANVFLDALAHERHAMGLPATSIQWGPFSEVGMAAAQDNRGQRAASRGVESLSPAEGVEALGRMITQPRPEVAVLRIDVRRFEEFYPQTASNPFWAEARAERASTGRDEKVPHARVALEGVPPAERRGFLERYIVEQLGRVLRLPADRIGKDTPFRNLGVDSLMSLEMRNRLESDLGLKLPSTLLFTYADTVSLAEHLLGRLAPPAEPVAEAASLRPESPAPPEAPLPEPGAEDFLAAFDATMSALTSEDGE